MKIVKPSYEILNLPDFGPILKHLEDVARTCYQSHDKTCEGSEVKMVQNLIKRNHTAMMEFADMTVRFTCDRGVSHELVRHRHCSFAQESTRYVKYDGEMEFILPCWFENPPSKNVETPEGQWMWAMEDAEERYQDMLSQGQSPQQARSVLPNSLKTEIVVKTNLRDWMHIFLLRCDKAAHPQMRELMIPLYEELKEKCPVIFETVEFNR